MEIRIRLSGILSRLVALLILAAPLAWLSLTLGEFEQAEIAKMSHQELLAYLHEGRDTSFGASYLLVAVLTLIYVALVEGLALPIRLIAGAFRGRPDTQEAETFGRAPASDYFGQRTPH
jgi:hypothetical protein